MRLSLSKSERLSSRTVFAEIATGRDSWKEGAFRLRTLDRSISESAVQVAFSVPKRTTRKAVDRNRIKRLMRECFRHLKPELYRNMAEKELQASFLFIYHGKQLPTPEVVSKTMSSLLERWIEEKCAR